MMKLKAIMTLVLSSGLNHSFATLACIFIMNGRPIPETMDPKMIVKNLIIIENPLILMCEYGCAAKKSSTESQGTTYSKAHSNISLIH